MKDQQTQNQFIELRAQGWSLARIATELHLSKTTLVDWNRTARQEIRDLKDVEVEALHERVLVSYELELQRFTSQLNRIEAVLTQRKLDCLSTESLFVLAAMVRRAVAPSHLCALADDPRRRGVAGCHVHPGPDGGPAMNRPGLLGVFVSSWLFVRREPKLHRFCTGSGGRFPGLKMQQSPVLAGLERGSRSRFPIWRLALARTPSFPHHARLEKRCRNSAEMERFSVL